MRAPVLVVHCDSALRKKLRQTLEAVGYRVMEATDAESGLEAIQASADSLVVLFNITLHKNAMTGADGIMLLGAAACDVRVARQHAFIVITPTHDQVEAALGHMLHYLAIPVLAEPVDMDVVVRTVDEVGSRLLVSA
jgi:DNA-binding NtrC family response regulator